MVAPAPTPLPPSVVLQLCLAQRGGDAVLRRGIAGLRALARQAHAIELRLALLLAWLRRLDPLELGFPSFGALCRELVDWRRSWIHQLVRLIESPLHQVKRAASEGLIPLRVAVRAPVEVGVEGQEAWLARAVLGEVGHGGEERERVVLAGEEAEIVRRARRLGRLLLGRAVPVREVDDFIVEAWRARRSAEELLVAARTPQPPPPAPTPLDLSWCEGNTWREGALAGGEEPAAGWVEPRSVAEALARLERLQAVLRGRRVVLARAWAVISHERSWACAGFGSARRFAEEVLGVSLRTAQRMARAGWALEWYPELEEAVRSGLSFGAVGELAPVVSGSTVVDWIAVAARVGRQELAKAVAAAQETSPVRVCRAYRAALRAADAWEATGSAREGSSGAATPAGQLHLSEQLRVALPHPLPSEGGARASCGLRAPPELPEASRWLLEQVHLPAERGFGAVKRRDGHRCQNPECGRLSLCNQAHHIVFRSHGGADTLENGVTLCRCCHLRGVHTGRMSVERVSVGGADALLWRLGPRRVLQLREPPPELEARSARWRLAAPSGSDSAVWSAGRPP